MIFPSHKSRGFLELEDDEVSLMSRETHRLEPTLAIECFKDLLAKVSGAGSIVHAKYTPLTSPHNFIIFIFFSCFLLFVGREAHSRQTFHSPIETVLNN